MQPLLFIATLACHTTTPTPTADPSGSDSATSAGDAGVTDDTGDCESSARVAFDWECTRNRDPDALPDCAAATTHSDAGGYSTSPYAETCEQRRVWTTACCEDFSKLSHDGQLYAGMTTLQGPWRYPVLYIQTAEEWAAVLADNSDPWTAKLPEIDFDEQIVVIVQDWENETCSFTVEDHGLLTFDSGARILRVRFGDHSGNCDPCAAEGGAMVIYAVDRADGRPRVCASTVESCD